MVTETARLEAEDQARQQAIEDRESDNTGYYEPPKE
jgi:hypothetical protein